MLVIDALYEQYTWQRITRARHPLPYFDSLLCRGFERFFRVHDGA